MSTAQTPEQILQQQKEAEAFNRGHDAAKRWYDHAIEQNRRHTSKELREAGKGVSTSPDFDKGWDAFCDEVAAGEEAIAIGQAAYRRRKLTDAAVRILTWCALAAVGALSALVVWGYATRQADIAAEQQRRADLAAQVRWLGSVASSRWFYRDGDLPGRPTNSVTMNNPFIEIGLKPDGTVVWRAVKQKPLPTKNTNGH